MASDQDEEYGNSSSSSLPTWAEQRGELVDYILLMIEWRRQRDFPPETDEEMAQRIADIVETQRARNIAIFHKLLSEDVKQGVSVADSTLSIIREYLRENFPRMLKDGQ